MPLPVVVPAGRDTPVAKIAIERLQEYAAATAEVIYVAPNTTEKPKNGLTILLGSAADSQELQRAWAGHPSAKWSRARPDCAMVEPRLRVVHRGLALTARVSSGRDSRRTRVGSRSGEPCSD